MEIRRRLAAIAALILVLIVAPNALAATFYDGTGNDISWPQCGGRYRTDLAPSRFGIVGVTGGRAFTQNPCLTGEFAWASNTPEGASLYMNLNDAVGSTAGNGAGGPYGEGCAEGSTCHARNYGWKAGQFALSYAHASGASATTWWLDIETDNSWSSSPAENQAVIQGALDCLLGRGPTGDRCGPDGAPAGVAVVGIYSTPDQWRAIAGDWAASASDGAPVSANWVARVPCGATLYTGATVWLTQHISGGYDRDVACAPG